MKRCWADSLGDCVSKSSGEHYVSKGLFRKYGKVKIWGFPWCSEPKTVGIEAAKSGILCTQHNSELSCLDTGAMEVFETIAKMIELSNIRGEITERRGRARRKRHRRVPTWTPVDYEVDGVLLERWTIKTLINIYAVQIPGVLKDQGSGFPPASIVELAFGRKPIEPPMGLYLAEMPDRNLYSADQVALLPLKKDGAEEHVVEGCLLLFRGFRFLLSLRSEPLPDRITGLPAPSPQLQNLSDTSEENWGDAFLLYHPTQIRDASGSKTVSQRITFKWRPS